MGRSRTLTRTAVALLGSTLPGGCVYRTETQVPAASPVTTTVVVTSSPGRVVNYPSGRYELYGDGVSTPYYWVRIPAGRGLGGGLTPPFRRSSLA